MMGSIVEMTVIVSDIDPPRISLSLIHI